ncbi:MAG: hypothetical protein KGV51_04800 [Moraxellaceae bacterium]|nr:hypothetical protein [Moraxellaceae bacterium]
MNKKPHCVPTHLDDVLYQALKNECFDTGLTASEYIRKLIADKLLTKYLQAKNTADNLAMLENYQNDKNHENAGKL